MAILWVYRPRYSTTDLGLPKMTKKAIKHASADVGLIFSVNNLHRILT
jgi:hypothetical protein